MKNMKQNKGITLVALIITIIVLLILAVVAISVVQGDGIISKAKLARKNYQEAQDEENLALAGYQATLDSINNEGNGGENSNSQQDITVKTDVSYVGCYADVDGNGTVDGVIFVDLMDSDNSEGEWTEDSYSYTPITTAKEYTITSTNYIEDTHFGAHPIISAKTGSTGNDRFYVMALEDLDSNKHHWYKNATSHGRGISGCTVGYITDYADITSYNFGTGRTNTYNMINKWNNSSYGDKTTTGDYVDMWGAIQNQEKYPITTNGTTGWFVPSTNEWAAFGDFMFNKIEREDKIKCTTSNTNDFGINDYWTSSLFESYQACTVIFSSGFTDANTISTDGYRVRLATTF